MHVTLGFHEGIAGVLLRGSVSYYDRAGKKLPISSAYGPKSHSFSGGLAPIQVKDKWGYVDKSGKIVIAPQFEDVDDFSGGLAPVKVRSEETTWCPPEPSGSRAGYTMRWGYIDKSGKVVIAPQFESADGFSEGLAAIHQCGKAFFIDQTGKTVIEDNFNYASAFSGGLARVEELRTGALVPRYIAKSGKPVWRAAP